MRSSRRPLRLLVALAVLIATLLAAAPASAAPGDWWQFGYTAANTRFNRNETTIGSANVGRLVVAARQQPTLGGGEAAHASAVAVANGRTYVQVGDYESGSDALLAYDPASFGSPARWQQPSGCGSTSPTVHLGIVFVGSIACRPSGDDGGDNALLSLDARTGAVRWQVAGVFGDPAVAGGRVFVGAGGQLQARSAATGALLWSRAGGPGSGSPTVTGGGGVRPGDRERRPPAVRPPGRQRRPALEAGSRRPAHRGLAGRGRRAGADRHQRRDQRLRRGHGRAPLEPGRGRGVVAGGGQRAGVRRAGPGHRCLAAVRRGAALDLGDGRLRGARGLGWPVYASATTLVGGEPVTYVDQFALGPAGPA